MPRIDGNDTDHAGTAPRGINRARTESIAKAITETITKTIAHSIRVLATQIRSGLGGLRHGPLHVRSGLRSRLGGLAFLASRTTTLTALGLGL